MSAGAGDRDGDPFGGEGEEEEEEEGITFNHSRRNLGFQGLAQKTRPDRLQRSWSSHLEGWTPPSYDAGTELRSWTCAVLQGSPFNNIPLAREQPCTVLGVWKHSGALPR